mgnify:CR=1 FL=1|jgi:DNA repair ATPase RecN
MNIWQKIINGCFAVIVTLLIFQNQQLENKIASSNAGDRLDKMDEDRQLIKDRLGIMPNKVNDSDDENLYWTVNERLESYGIEIYQNQSAIEAQTKGIDAIERDIKKIERTLEALKRLPKPRSVETIRKIIEKCKVPTWTAGGLSNTTNHGHKSLKC